jgi:lipopolysaccharide export LptBFGC system permease protein LptF
VGRVPYDLQSKSMASVAIWQLDKNGKPLFSIRATSAKWFFSTREWRLAHGKTYFYHEDGIPRVQSWDYLDIPGWRETPWKVLSSAQNPDHLGIPGLTTFLKNNADYDSRVLAPFRTNWWYCWAEPLSCLVMVLIAAPLGIVYSRRGVLGGVAASIFIFALIYFLSGTLTAMGKGRYLPPFIAAWATNFIFAGVGAALLFYRAKNREIPTFKTLMSRYRARRSSTPASV